METLAHKFRIVVLGVGILFCANSPVVATEVAPTSSPTRVTGAPGMSGAVYKFFDDKTGERTGELRIGRVDMEYRRQGFMRVAWRPLVVLAKVDFEISAALAWPEQGTQLVRALESLGGRDELVLRDVRVHLAGAPDRELLAATARLMPGGALELSDAVLSASGAAATAQQPGTYRLVLTGPDAGRLARSVPTALRRNPDILSSSNTLTQLTP